MYLNYTRFNIWFLGCLLGLLTSGYILSKPFAAHPGDKPAGPQLPLIIPEVNKNFSRVQFDELTKDLIGTGDAERRDRQDWLNSLYAFTRAYQSFIDYLIIEQQGDGIEARITTTGERSYYFADGKITPPADYEQKNRYRSYLYAYPLGETNSKPEPCPFPEPMNYAFFNEIYGSSAVEREQHLETLNVWGRQVKFNSRNNAAQNLRQVVAEISRLAKTDAEVKKWLNNIQSITTYNNRKIANANRPSFHSWGIAIDILPKGKWKALYWLWVNQYKEDWWNLEETEKAHYPSAVVGIFEKYGFTWGGKWYHYDLMHFEYQPEVIRYNTPPALQTPSPEPHPESSSPQNLP